MTKKYPGIKSFTYNKSKRAFETTLINDQKGPDILIDALILSDSDVEKAKSNHTSIGKNTELLNKLDTTEMKRVYSDLESTYNKGVSELMAAVTEIEKKVTPNG